MQAGRPARSIRGYYFKYMLIGFSITLLVIAALSLYAINSVLENKVRMTIESGTELIGQSLHNELLILESVTTQVSSRCLYEQTLLNMVTSPRYFTRQQAGKALEDYVRQVTASTQSIALVAVLDGGSRHSIFANRYLKAEEAAQAFTFADTARYNAIWFQAPHPSILDGTGRAVLSARVDMNIASHDQPVPVRVYVESSVDLDQFLADASYGGCFRIRDSAGEVLFVSDEAYDLSASHMVSYPLDAYGMTLEYAILESEYYNERNTYFLSILLAFALSFLVTLVLTRKFTGDLVRPVNYMLQGVKQLENAHSAVQGLAPYGYVEFDALIGHINEAQRRIHTLFQDLQDSEKHSSEIQMLFLRAQINPHFLYNSLNAIQWMARMHGAPQIDRYAEAFVNVLRYNLDKDGASATVGSELELVRTYMMLLQVRYGDRVNIALEVAPGVLSTPMPKFIIQPLVENAIYHGLPDQQGNIRIAAYRTGADWLVVEVENDGAPMEQAQIDRIIGMRHSKDGIGIGIRYVQEMLHFQYGEAFTMDFLQPDSRCGLLVRIRMDLRAKRDTANGNEA